MYNKSLDWSIGDWRSRCGVKSTAPNTTNKLNKAINNIIVHNTIDRFVEQHWAIFVNVLCFYTFRERTHAWGRTSTDTDTDKSMRKKCIFCFPFSNCVCVACRLWMLNGHTTVELWLCRNMPRAPWCGVYLFKWYSIVCSFAFFLGHRTIELV